MRVIGAHFFSLFINKILRPSVFDSSFLNINNNIKSTEYYQTRLITLEIFSPLVHRLQ